MESVATVQQGGENAVKQVDDHIVKIFINEKMDEISSINFITYSVTELVDVPKFIIDERKYIHREMSQLDETLTDIIA